MNFDKNKITTTKRNSSCSIEFVFTQTLLWCISGIVIWRIDVFSELDYVDAVCLCACKLHLQCCRFGWQRALLLETFFIRCRRQFKSSSVSWHCYQHFASTGAWFILCSRCIISSVDYRQKAELSQSNYKVKMLCTHFFSSDEIIRKCHNANCLY